MNAIGIWINGAVSLFGVILIVNEAYGAYLDHGKISKPLLLWIASLVVFVVAMVAFLWSGVVGIIMMIATIGLAWWSLHEGL